MTSQCQYQIYGNVQQENKGPFKLLIHVYVNTDGRNIQNDMYFLEEILSLLMMLTWAISFFCNLKTPAPPLPHPTPPQQQQK